MISIEIKEVKDFMNKLLRQDIFDKFEVHSIDLSHYYNLSIEGLINKDALMEDAPLRISDQVYINWTDIKENILDFIKGNKTLSQLKITFLLSQKSAQNIIQRANTSLTLSDIGGFKLNIVYENHNLKIVTATNYKTFTLDKSIEEYYDQSIIKFLNKHGIE